VNDKSFRNPQASRWLDFWFGPNELDRNLAIVLLHQQEMVIIVHGLVIVRQGGQRVSRCWALPCVITGDLEMLTIRSNFIDETPI
jgi:hypothetical protein